MRNRKWLSALYHLSLSSSPLAGGDFSCTPCIPLCLSSAAHFQTHPPLLGATTPVDTVALRACETRMVRANPYTIRVQRPLLRPIATACYQELNYNVSRTKRRAVFITPLFPTWQTCAAEQMLLWSCVVWCDLGWNYNVRWWSWHSHEAGPLKESCSLRFA